MADPPPQPKSSRLPFLSRSRPGWSRKSVPNSAAPLDSLASVASSSILNSQLNYSLPHNSGYSDAFSHELGLPRPADEGLDRRASGPSSPAHKSVAPPRPPRSPSIARIAPTPTGSRPPPPANSPNSISLETSATISQFALQADLSSIQLLVDDLEAYRTLLAPGATAQAGQLIAQEGWTTHWVLIEVGLLLALTSLYPDIRALAGQGLALVDFVDQALITAGGADQVRPSPVLREIIASVAASPPGTAAEPAVYARRVIGRLGSSTVALAIAWDEAARRWQELTFQPGEGHKGPKPDAADEWINLAAFLLAGSGVCVNAPEYMRLESVVSLDRLPPKHAERVNRPQVHHLLIAELVDLLGSSSLRQREAALEVLSDDLSAVQFGIFFRHLHTVVAQFRDKKTVDLQEENAFFFLVEQVVRVVLRISKRVLAPLSPGASSAIDRLIISFATQVQKLGFTPQGLRIKAALCELCTALLESGARTSPDDSRVRNEMLELVVGWGSEARPGEMDSEQAWLAQELDGALCKTLVPLLAGLVVHGVDPSAPPVELELGSDPKLVHRYCDFFAFALFRQTGAEAGSARRAGGSVANRRLLISALANLITANLSVAVTRLPEMMLEQEVNTRGAYLETIVGVLDKGARLDQLPAQSSTDTWAQLVAVLRQPNLSLAVALCEVCPSSQFEELIEVLFKVFHTQPSLVQLLKAVIELEVSATDHESTLFRGNSFATRILTVYARTRGYHYLRETLKELLSTVCSKPDGFVLDFDPHRESPDDGSAVRNLEQITAAFLSTISNSLDEMPQAIREITAHIADAVGSRFPESIFTAVGGFIFLRFINPAIVSPETVDLDLPNDNRDIRRSLVLVTKVLQALANNVRFGAKEPGMRQLNGWMDINIFTMTRFLQAISIPVVIETTLSSAYVDPFDAVPESCLDHAEQAFLHQFLADQSSKLGMALLHARQTVTQQQHANGALSPRSSQTWNQLTSLLAALGPAGEDPTKSASLIKPGQTAEAAYRELMQRSEARLMADGSVWRNVFYEIGPTKTATLAFCLVLGTVKAELADLEGLLYHILKVSWLVSAGRLGSG